MLRRGLLIAVLCFFLAGCGAHVFHIVERGDTLYSVSFRYQQDYRNIAYWNGLQPPYALTPGQELRVAPPRAPSFGERLAAEHDPARRAAANSRPAPAAARAPAAPQGSHPASAPEEAVTIPLEQERAPARPATPAPQSRPPAAVARAAPPAKAKAPGPAALAPLRWQWPVHRPDARIVPERKGLEIRAARGEPVYAAADGRVVYGGSGIPHFGNLIIIKHDERFLSAYAHNQRLLVAEGAQVRAGQQIAEMGDTGTGTQEVKLHFEIRLDGAPVDPMQYLPRRGG